MSDETELNLKCSLAGTVTCLLGFPSLGIATWAIADALGAPAKIAIGTSIGVSIFSFFALPCVFIGGAMLVGKYYAGDRNYFFVPTPARTPDPELEPLMALSV
jgi:hypothetical protein